MKPRTKMQKFITEETKKINWIGPEVIEWAKETVLNKFVTFSYKTIHYCMECGHKWKANVAETQKAKKVTCPCCKNKLIIPYGERENYLRQEEYFLKFETIGNIQVIRKFIIIKMMFKKKKASYSIFEVSREHILEDGRIAALSLAGSMGSGYYRQTWQFGSGLEFRNHNWGNTVHVNYNFIYPKKKFTKLLRRNGIKNSTHGLDPLRILKGLLVDTRLETVFKSKDYSIAKYILETGNDAVEKYWSSIKICKRNGYKIKDFSIWKDMLDILDFFGKDIHSPKYICPDDLFKAHDKYLSKKRKFDREKRAQELKEEIQRDNKIYVKRKSKFFDLKFSQDNLVIVPLYSVEQVLEESDELSHCAFTNGYHNKKSSLLFSATIEGKKTETVEVSLKTFKVLQCRGFKNNPTKYNSKIVKLMEKNMDKIKNIQLKKKVKEFSEAV